MLLPKEFYNNDGNYKTVTKNRGDNILQGVYTKEDEKNATIEFDVPGITLKDLTAEFYEGILTVSAKTDTRSYIYRIIVKNVDVNKAKTELKDGVFTVTIPYTNTNKKINLLA